MRVLSGSARFLAGALALGTVVAVALFVPATTAVGVAASVAADPVRFGLVVAGLYLVRPLLALPTTPLAVVVGYGYGVALGLPIALAGVVGTVIPVFLVARGLAAGDTPPVPDALVTDRVQNVVRRATRAVDRYYGTAGPVRGVVASRLAPIPSDVSTCAAAVRGVRLRHLLVGTAVGELPWTVAAVLLGASASTATARGVGDGWLALTFACVLAAGLLLARPVVRRRREPSSPSDATRSVDG